MVISNLAENLELLGAARYRDSEDWHFAAQDYGRVLGLLLKDGFWPESLATRAPDERRRSNRSALEWLASFLPFQGPRRRRFLRSGERPMGGFEGAIWDSCRALGVANLRWIESFFAPFWNYFPAEMSAVSEKGLTWAVVLDQLWHWGPRRFLKQMSSEHGRQFLAGAEFGPGDTAADCLSLHCGIEDLLSKLTAQYRLAPAGPACDPPRQSGGFRSRSFLIQYEAVRQWGETRRGPMWLRAVNLLIDASPLTRLIYADLTLRSAAERERAARDFAPLKPAPRTAERGGPGAFAPLLVPPGEAARWWHDLWFSHLARSITGALLSPPPAAERRLRAEAVLKVLSGKASQRAGRHRRIPESLQNAIFKCESTVQELRQEEAQQSAARIVLLGEILNAGENQAQAPDAAPTSAGGVRYMQLRLLDMLVRHFVAKHMLAIHHGFHTALNEGAPDTIATERVLNALASPACFRTFSRPCWGRIPLNTRWGT